MASVVVDKWDSNTESPLVSKEVGIPASASPEAPDKWDALTVPPPEDEWDALTAPPSKGEDKWDSNTEPTSKYLRRANSDLGRLEGLAPKFQHAANTYGVPIDLLAGIASRESNMGKALRPTGWAPDRQGFGIMQVDKRHHKVEGDMDPASQEHINQAANILKDNKRTMDKKFPSWTEDQRWRGAVAAYNRGPGAVKSFEHIDAATADGDYSKDVLERARLFRLQLMKGK